MLTRLDGRGGGSELITRVLAARFPDLSAVYYVPGVERGRIELRGETPSVEVPPDRFSIDVRGCDWSPELSRAVYNVEARYGRLHVRGEDGLWYEALAVLLRSLDVRKGTGPHPSCDVLFYREMDFGNYYSTAFSTVSSSLATFADPVTGVAVTKLSSKEEQL